MMKINSEGDLYLSLSLLSLSPLISLPLPSLSLSLSLSLSHLLPEDRQPGKSPESNSSWGTMGTARKCLMLPHGPDYSGRKLLE